LATYIQYRLDPDRQGHPGHLIQVVTKEPRIRENSIVGKGLYARAGLETGSWLVEGNMAIGADAAQEQLNATSFFNLRFVRLAFGFKVRSIAVEDIDIFGPNVYMREKVLVHEAVVTLRVLPRYSDVLVLQWISRLYKAMLLCYVVQQGAWILRKDELTILKVITLRKEISPALCRWTRLWYIKTGLLPVGKPSTNGFSAVGLKTLMRSASRR
jgi:hypothetical protein